MSVCETAKGGLATYFRLMHEATSDRFAHLFLLPDSHYEPGFASMRVQVFRDPGSRLGRCLAAARLALRTARERSPDVLFFHSTFALPVMLLMQLARVRGAYVYCPHGWAAHRYPDGSLKRSIVAGIERWMSGMADAVINISSHDFAHAAGAGAPGLHRLIENAVPDASVSAAAVPFHRDGAALHAVFIGRFDRQKGIDLLLEAFNRVAASRSDLRLHLIGEPVLRDNHGAALHVDSSRVSLHGWLAPQQIHDYCAAADVVVVPSRWEGFGLVVAEAYRAGTPVLVSDRGALPGLVEQGRTGFVVPLGVNELATALSALDKASLAAMRPACREEYERRFHPSRFGRELTELLLELLAPMSVSRQVRQLE